MEFYYTFGRTNILMILNHPYDDVSQICNSYMPYTKVFLGKDSHIIFLHTLFGSFVVILGFFQVIKLINS